LSWQRPQRGPGRRQRRAQLIERPRQQPRGQRGRPVGAHVRQLRPASVLQHQGQACGCDREAGKITLLVERSSSSTKTLPHAQGCRCRSTPTCRAVLRGLHAPQHVLRVRCPALPRVPRGQHERAAQGLLRQQCPQLLRRPLRRGLQALRLAAREPQRSEQAGAQRQALAGGCGLQRGAARGAHRAGRGYSLGGRVGARRQSVAECRAEGAAPGSAARGRPDRPGLHPAPAPARSMGASPGSAAGGRRGLPGLHPAPAAPAPDGPFPASPAGPAPAARAMVAVGRAWLPQCAAAPQLRSRPAGAPGAAPRAGPAARQSSARPRLAQMAVGPLLPPAPAEAAAWRHYCRPVPSCMPGPRGAPRLAAACPLFLPIAPLLPPKA
jgi:hypothetical protein